MECAEQFPLQLIDPISDSTLIWEEPWWLQTNNTWATWALDGCKQTILVPPMVAKEPNFLWHELRSVVVQGQSQQIV